jgi:hypothetical protein
VKEPPGARGSPGSPGSPGASGAAGAPETAPEVSRLRSWARYLG